MLVFRKREKGKKSLSPFRAAFSRFKSAASSLEGRERRDTWPPQQLPRPKFLWLMSGNPSNREREVSKLVLVFGPQAREDER